MTLYTIWKTDGADSGDSARFEDQDVDSLLWIGEVTADHSTAAILAASSMYTGAGEGQWVAIPKDQLCAMVLNKRTLLEPGS